MAYEFKKLGDVEVVETPMDTANVLIEEDGVIKKVAKDEVGGVKVASAAEVGQTIVVKAVDKNGKPTEWECANFPEGVKSWHDLENKPFYEEVNETVIFPEEELTYNADYGDIIIFKPFTLVVGEEYIVNWDSKEYKLTAEQFGPSIMLGSMKAMTGDATIPFAIICGGFSEYSGLVVTLPGVTHAVMSIKQRENVVHTIDPKYIKDMYYEEISRTSLIKDFTFTTKTSTTTGSERYVHYEYAGDLGYYPNLEVGYPYIITVDGVDYEVVPTTDSSTADDFSQCPVIIGQGSSGNVCFETAAPDKTHTVSFYYVEKDIVTIPAKYIKDMYYETGEIEYILENFNLGGTYHHGMGNMMCPLDPVVNFDNLEDGQKCYLDFNGVVYEGSFISSGNARVNFENVEFNGKTFPITVYTDEIAMSDAYMADNSVWSTANISVYIGGIEVHTIDPKYIKDMYYSEGGRVYEYKNEDLSTITQGSQGMGRVTLSKTSCEFSKGQTWYFEYAGNTYVTVPSNDNGLFFSNVYSPDYPDSRPMSFSFNSGSNTVGIGSAFDVPRNWEGLTFSLYIDNEVVHTIPEKYLPQPITFVEDNSGNVTAPLPFEEIYTRAKNGFMDFNLKCYSPSVTSFRFLRATESMSFENSSLAIFFVNNVGTSICVELHSDGTTKLTYSSNE